ncbi:hypothetical protein [Streptomyces sp. NPDC059970]|uniref:hypothetical protein n=1 Tax=Streptomyces sp. NPDC059970 TaxID=3347019 RepID=UPI0036B8C413
MSSQGELLRIEGVRKAKARELGIARLEMVEIAKALSLDACVLITPAPTPARPAATRRRACRCPCSTAPSSYR